MRNPFDARDSNSGFHYSSKYFDVTQNIDYLTAHWRWLKIIYKC